MGRGGMSASEEKLISEPRGGGGVEWINEMPSNTREKCTCVHNWTTFIWLGFRYTTIVFLAQVVALPPKSFLLCGDERLIHLISCLNFYNKNFLSSYDHENMDQEIVLVSYIISDNFFQRIYFRKGYLMCYFSVFFWGGGGSRPR